MRVLHISNDVLVGGVESFLITLARNKTIDETVRHDFAFTAEGPAINVIRLAGAQVHYLGSASYRQPKALHIARRRLNELCRECKYDIAVFHQYPYLVLGFADVLWRRSVKMVRYFHNETVPRSRIERLVGFLHARFLDLTVFDSHFLRQCMPDDAIATVVYYPVDRQMALSETKRNEVRARLATPAQDPIVVQVSRMEERKGHTRLLRTLAALKSLRWTCWIVGGPQKVREIAYFNALKELAEDLGIADRICFLGTRTDVPELLAAADIFCHPNTHPPEPFGIVFVEALQAGLPVVTTAMGGATEIVSEQCGFLVPPEDDIALAGALRRLLTEDPLRQKMSISARERGQMFGPSVQIPTLNAALRTALQND